MEEHKQKIKDAICNLSDAIADLDHELSIPEGTELDKLWTWLDNMEMDGLFKGIVDVPQD